MKSEKINYKGFEIIKDKNGYGFKRAYMKVMCCAGGYMIEEVDSRWYRIEPIKDLIDHGHIWKEQGEVHIYENLASLYR